MTENTIAWRRWLLLLAILIAVARLAWGLDAKNLWWDESLSLQRAEGSLPDLVMGRLTMSDGLFQAISTDQHPPVYFLLLGLMVRLAGASEFALRFPSLMAAALLTPAAWALARRLARRGALPRGTAEWAALLTAMHPFYLWYGQEARMYTLVALLAVLSTYLLLRWTDEGARRGLAGYLIATALLLGSHYLSVLLLPVHAALIYQHLLARGRRRALLATAGLLVAGLLLTLVAAWLILRQPGGGSNFRPISLRLLAPDLLNAFSLGLSVDIARVWPLDLLFGAMALVGAAWGLRSLRRVGWLLPALILVPVALLQVGNRIQPAYMNARHLSLISGAFILAVAGGVAWLARRQRILGRGLAAVLLGAMLYSTVNYFTLPQYGKDDFTGLGAYLRCEMQPGDLLLLNPRDMLRLFRYYLPVDEIEAADGRAGWRAMPTLWGDWPETERQLELGRGQYRRIWLVTSTMFPYADPQGRVEQWLTAHALRVREEGFHSPNATLKLKLYLAGPPVVEGTAVTSQHPVGATFGDHIRLSGYDVGRPLWSGAAAPVTLYWQAVSAGQRRYKYLLRLESGAPGQPATLAITEREPYDGAIPTTVWRSGITIVEYSQVDLPAELTACAHYCRLSLQIYDAATLTKLPLTHAAGATAGADGFTLYLSHLP